MNLEEVKVRLSNLDHGKIVKYDHAMNLATQFMLDYKNDVTYLLSIIKQKDAELDKAIAEIKFQVERNDRQREGYFKQEAIILQAEKVLTYYAEEPYLESIGYNTNAIEALKAIRGN